MPDQAPDGSIIISPKEFYDGYRQDIADIKTAVAPLTPMVEDVIELKRQVSALEARLTAEEKKVVWLFGVGFGLASLANYVIPQLTK